MKEERKGEEQKYMNREQMICSCVKIRAGAIMDGVDQGAKTYDDMQKITNCGSSCGNCRIVVEKVMREYEEEKKLRISHASLADVEEMARIEAASYPKEEAASLESIGKRVQAFPSHFWLLKKEGKILAFINGMVTDEPDLTDVMYDQALMHNHDGAWQMIFSVVTGPAHRKKGYASMVMKQVIADAKEEGRKGIVLTCKEALLGFYGSFGFENEGISESTHGNVKWYQMRLKFSE